MEGIRVCPHCGGKTLMAYVKHGGIVESKGIDEHGQPIYELVKENANKYELEIIGCANCKARITEADLIGGVACKHCGKMVAPDDLDEDGNCGACSLIIKNPELANASNEDLLRLLARAYRGVNPLNEKIDKRIEAGVEAEAMATGASQGSTAADDILNGVTPPDVQDGAKKTRRRAVRKKTDTEADQNGSQGEEEASTPAPEEVPVEGVDDAEQALQGAQDAPFPEVPQEYQAPTIPAQEQNPQEVTPVPGEPQPAPAAGFQMFEGEEDAF